MMPGRLPILFLATLAAVALVPGAAADTREPTCVAATSGDATTFCAGERRAGECEEVGDHGSRRTLASFGAYESTYVAAGAGASCWWSPEHGPARQESAGVLARDRATPLGFWSVGVGYADTQGPGATHGTGCNVHAHLFVERVGLWERHQTPCPGGAPPEPGWGRLLP